MPQTAKRTDTGAGALVLALAALLISSAAAETVEVKVTAVSRGDVLVIDRDGKTETVLIYGVECSATNTPMGTEARAYTRDALLGKRIRIEVRKQQYNLTYVDAFKESGRSLASELLKLGLAKRDRIIAPEAPELDAMEARAQSAQLGMWRTPELPPLYAPIERKSSLADPESEIGKFKQRRENTRLAKFELALVRWREIDEETRTAVRQAYRSRAATQERNDQQRLRKDARRVNELSQMQNASRERADKLQQQMQKSIDSEASELKEIYSDPASRRRSAENDLRDENGLVWVPWDRSLPPLTSYQIENRLGEYLDGKVQEDAAAEAAEASARYERERQVIRASVGAAQTERARFEASRERAQSEQRVSESLARKRSGRNSARLDLIATLNEAIETGYVPRLRLTEIATWSGSKERETGDFKVGTDVWAIALDTPGRYGQRNVSVDVYLSEGRRLVTRIRNNTQPYQSFAVLESPGHYFLIIKTDGSVSHSIKVEEIR